MSKRKEPFVPGEYYHLYNRGNSKQVIFRNKTDYHHFIKLLYLVNSKENLIFRDLYKDFNTGRSGDRLVYIGAYCLMPDHFHLIVTQPDKGNISKFMQKLLTAYSMYFNAKYSHTGSLFEGKFRSKYINSNRHMRHLFSYVLLNPIKLINKDWREEGIEDREEAINFLNKYDYSSFKDSIGRQRLENKVINRGHFPDYFYNPEVVTEDIFEWICYDTNLEKFKKQVKKIKKLVSVEDEDPAFIGQLKTI
jgi:putative transposase